MRTTRSPAFVSVAEIYSFSSAFGSIDDQSSASERHSPRLQISTKIRSFSQNLIEQKARPPPLRWRLSTEITMQRPDSNKESVVQIRPGLYNCVQPIRSDRITICSVRYQAIRNNSTGIGFHKCVPLKVCLVQH